MMDFKEIANGDIWEMFARDYLAEIGFTIDVGPGRGADAGRDMLVSEQISGKIHTSRFLWLVSCKHNAHGGGSVGPSEEQNITDRIRQHKAQGFIGLYSTIPSSGLVERLRNYKEDGSIRDYEIFDAAKIEKQFIATGMSKLAIRYFPLSYRKMRPVQQLLNEKLELECSVCHADLLLKSVTEPYSANVVFGKNRETGVFEEIHTVCKKECDRKLDRQLFQNGYITVWQDIGDLSIPLYYLKSIFSLMNSIRSGKDKFSDEAYSEIKRIYIAIAQRTLREHTSEDIDRISRVLSLDRLGI